MNAYLFADHDIIFSIMCEFSQLWVYHETRIIMVWILYGKCTHGGEMEGKGWNMEAGSCPNQLKHAPPPFVPANLPANLYSWADYSLYNTDVQRSMNLLRDTFRLLVFSIQCVCWFFFSMFRTSSLEHWLSGDIKKYESYAPKRRTTQAHSNEDIVTWCCRIPSGDNKFIISIPFHLLENNAETEAKTKKKKKFPSSLFHFE